MAFGWLKKAANATWKVTKAPFNWTHKAILKPTWKGAVEPAYNGLVKPVANAVAGTVKGTAGVVEECGSDPGQCTEDVEEGVSASLNNVLGKFGLNIKTAAMIAAGLIGGIIILKVLLVKNVSAQSSVPMVIQTAPGNGPYGFGRRGKGISGLGRRFVAED